MTVPVAQSGWLAARIVGLAVLSVFVFVGLIRIPTANSDPASLVGPDPTPWMGSEVRAGKWSEWEELELRADFDGWGMIWLERCEVAVRMRVLHRTRDELVEIDYGPEATSRVARVPLARGERVLVELMPQSAPVSESYSLHLGVAWESERTRVVAEQAQQLDELLAVDGARQSLAIQDRLWEIVDKAGANQDWLEQLDALEPIVAFGDRMLPPDHAKQREALRLAGETRWRIGRLVEAVAFLGRYVEALESGPCSEDELWRARLWESGLIGQLGQLGLAMGRMEQLEQDILASGRTDHALLPTIWQNLAGMLLHQGQFERGIELHERYLAHLEAELAADDPKLLQEKLRLVSYLIGRKEIERPLAITRQVLALRRRVAPPGDSLVLQAEYELAFLSMMNGDWIVARDTFERVLAGYEAAFPDPHDRRIIKVRLELADALARVGDLEAAGAMSRQALAAARQGLEPTENFMLEVQFAAARHHLLQGEWGEARRLLEELVRACRGHVANEPLLLASKISLAMALRESGELEAALPMARECAQLLRSSSNSHPLERISGELELARTLRQVGQFEEARSLVEETIAELEAQAPLHRLHLRALDDAAWILAQQGDVTHLSMALERLADALQERVDLDTWTLSPREAETQAMNWLDPISTLLNLVEILQEPQRGPLQVQIFSLIESLRGTGLFGSRLVRIAAADEQAQALRRDVRQASFEVAQSVQHPRDATRYLASIRARERAQRALRAHLHSQVDSVLLENLRPDAARLARELAPDEALVSYWAYQRMPIRAGVPDEPVPEPTLMAYVIRSGKALQRFELGALSKVQRIVDSYTAGKQKSQLHAASLREQMLDPLFPALLGARRLAFVLVEPLQTVAIDALPYQDGWIGDEFEVRIFPSLRANRLPIPTGSAEARLLALGGIDYERAEVVAEAAGERRDAVATPIAEASARVRKAKDKDRSFPPLPTTRSEVERIASLFEDHWGRTATVLTGSQAHRESLIANARKARFLHIATHGFHAPVQSSTPARPPSMEFAQSLEDVRGLSPLALSGMALAGANDDSDPERAAFGVLTAEEIAALDLRHCELTVLSACSTRVGVSRLGQGLASLQRAFHMAGSHYVLAAMWEVPDDAAHALMVRFYDRLWTQEMPPYHALWAAKQDLREQRRPDGRPLYPWADWAGWSLSEVRR